jgi:hypothetical protein
MSIIREDLILPEGFTLKPNSETYVRVGKVVSVSLFSRDLLVQYIDGEHTVENVPVEVAVLATVVVGSDDPLSSFAPSASVYGRGDLVAILLMGETGERYVISAMDNYVEKDDVYRKTNRRGAALVNGWALFDVLNGLVVDIVDDGENSFIKFWDFNTHVITTILGNPDEFTGKRVMRRMLDYFGTIGQPDGYLSHNLSVSYPTEGLGGGPQANPQERLLGQFWDLGNETYEQFDVAATGNCLNGFKQIVDRPYGAADLEAKLTAHHPTLEYLWLGQTHPQGSTSIEIVYEPTVFRFGDVDSDYVLIAAVFPAWNADYNTCTYINFIEIPAYCLAERKRMNLAADVDPEAPVDQYLDSDRNTHAWQLYAEDIRVLETIERTWIQWSDLAVDFMYSERASRALPIIASRYKAGDPSGYHSFGILDSRSYMSGSTPLDVAKINRILGTISREARGEGDYAPNGSPWNYTITHNDPQTGIGIVDNFYTGRFKYFNDGAGDVWETHTCETPDKEYPCITNGEESLTKKIDFNFDMVGELTYNTNDHTWDELTSYSTHEWWEHFYLNGVLLYTDYYQRIHETDPQHNIIYDHVYRILLHVDLEMELVVAEEHETQAEGYLIVGTTVETVRCVVFWQGQRYVIWEMEFTDNHFPYWKNFPYPWCADQIKDGGYPERPETVPHDTNTTHNSIFWWPPTITVYSVNPFPFLPGTKGKMMSYPFIHGEDTAQVMMGKIINDDNESGEGKSGVPYLQVSTDMATGSWVVKAPMWFYEQYENDTVATYPGVYDILSRHADINGGTPFYGTLNANDIPILTAAGLTPVIFDEVVENIIELNKAPVEEE